MHDRDFDPKPAEITFDTPPWDHAEELPPAPTVEQLHVLRRIAQGEGLFRFVDADLQPRYDFGPDAAVEPAVVATLIESGAIEFQGSPGFALAARARLTARGQALIEAV